MLDIYVEACVPVIMKGNDLNQGICLLHKLHCACCPLVSLICACVAIEEHNGIHTGDGACRLQM